jgi:predicted acylesterase/phospholipase RssA
VPDEMTPDRSIAIALSGGGKRAALFALGGIAACVDAGVNQDIVTVSSVSGGSITNAALACHFDDLSTATGVEMRAFCEAMMVELATRRHMFRVRWIFAIGLAFFFVLNLSVVTRFQDSIIGLSPSAGRLKTDSTANVLLNIVVTLGIASAAFVARTNLQMSVIDRAVTSPGRSRDYRRRNRIKEALLGRLDESSVSHCLCATDVPAMAPIFFVGSRVVAFDGTFRTNGKLPVAEAVTASAAFPGAFYPARLKVTQVDEDGSTKDRTLIVTDGGAWNNLGTDLALAGSVLHSLPSASDGFYYYPVDFAEATDTLLVLDSSAGWGDDTPVPDYAIARAVPLAGWMIEFLYVKRIFSAIYASGLIQRTNLLSKLSLESPEAGVHYIPMASPLELARAFQGNDDADIAERAAEVETWLVGLADAERWQMQSNATARMKTHLKKVKSPLASTVALCGYYNTAAMLWIKLGARPSTEPDSALQGLLCLPGSPGMSPTTSAP